MTEPAGGDGPALASLAHLTPRGTAPECPASWSIGPPDFVGVGAQRGGTKWWYELVVDHPGVQRVAAVKRELHFFEQFWAGGFSAEDIGWYHRFFPRPGGAVVGEWTPRYMLDFWTPRLLKEAAPEAKLLVLLRDPVERYRSAIARELRLASRRAARISPMLWSDAVARGRYAGQLDRLFRFFDRDRVLILQYERCRRDPSGELARTYDFLGVPRDHLPAEPTEQVGRALAKTELPDSLRDDLVAALLDDVCRLALGCPELDLSLWPNFRHVS